LRRTKPRPASALLNLGHTFGHAIETGSGYGSWLHGEAVATGMVMAADLSRRLGWLSATDTGRIEALVRRARLPLRAPTGLDQARMLDLMAVDKKVQDGRLRLVLMKALGQAVIVDDAPRPLICQTLDACRAGA
jgi:3-dehydroquinate synthase